jgi:TDG/mug DNA glycosylase family protein
MLPDYLEDNLAVVFVGTSVATASARRGHYYGGPGNKFWELLWEAGLTGERILSPEQDAWVLRYGIGLTDVVKSLAASSDSLLKSTDYDVPASL